MALRVVAGTFRGRRLEAPSGDQTRPTSDRVREATFNSLDAHGLLRGAKVLDLFAGSGALGIEALSRGADAVTFVESSREAASVIRQNISTLGIGDRCEVAQTDASRFGGIADDYDLVLADPPYAFDGWDALIGSLNTNAIVIESDRQILDSDRYGEFGEAPFEVIRERRYGTTVVTIAVSRRREGHGDQQKDSP